MFICKRFSVHDNEGPCDSPGERASWVPSGNPVEPMSLTLPHLTAFPLLPRLPLQVVYGVFIVLLELLI